MKVIFDHNVDRRFRRHFRGHTIHTAREMRWDEYENGELLAAAEAAAFDAFLSVDKHIEHEQNLSSLPLPVIILDSRSNALKELILFAPHVLRLLSGPLDKALYRILSDGEVIRRTK